MIFSKHAMATAISLALSATAYAAGEIEQQKSPGQGSSPGSAEIHEPAGRSAPMAEDAPPEAGMQQAQQPVVAGQPLLSKSASELKGMEIQNRNNEEMGEVAKVVIDPQTDQLYAVVSVGGLLGVGDKMIALDLDQLELREDHLVAPNVMTQDELKNRPEYVAENYRELEDERILGHAAAEASGTPGSDRFATLDENSDGHISREEASQALQSDWQNIDANNDQKIDRAEFSAFERSE